VILLTSTERFRPTWRANSVASIDFGALAELSGIHYAIIDLDGTLAPTLSPTVCPSSIENLLGAKANRWLLDSCLLSNCWLSFMARRAEKIARASGLKCCACYWPNPLKPDTGAFEQALAKMAGARADNTVVIGDQFGTDILGANRLGICSIWVPPMEPIPPWKRITLELINQSRLRALGEIPETPTRDI
jgi:uncharacterized protein